MRVDTAPAAAPFDDLDPLTRLKRYVSLLRRRWYLVAVPVLVGAMLGWFSGGGQAGAVNNLGVPVPTTTYYRAAHILIGAAQNSSTNQNQTPVNLAQAAYLVNTGEVPGKVAFKLGLSTDTVKKSLLGIPRQEVSSVEVQAIGTDKKAVVTLADTAADELLTTLKAQAKAESDTNRDQIISKLDKLDGDIKALDIQIAASPSNISQLQAQQRSLTNQYSLVYEQFSQLANTPEPSAGLNSLEGAKATEISKTEYNRVRDTIRNGADYVTGASTTVPQNSGPSAPSAGVSRSTRAELGGLLGLALGVGLVLLLDRFDGRLRRRVDVEAATGLTVVAEIPPLNRQQQRDMEVVAHTQQRSQAAEAFRVVRGAIMFALDSEHSVKHRVNGQATVLMVTSSNPGEGKTTTVANLAAVLVEGGFSVLVINCDFRRPKIHDYLRGAGLRTNGDGRPAEAVRLGSVVVADTDIAGLRLITGIGEDDPHAVPLDVVATQRKIIQMARPNFDVILLDTAPFLTTNDASELLGETDQVLLVVRAGKTQFEAARRIAEILDRFEAPVLGVVMNDSNDSPAAQYYYGYSYGRFGKRRRDPVTPVAEPVLTPSQNGVTPVNGVSTQNGASPEVREAPVARVE